MFGMGGSEILVILIVALLFLGPDKLPEAAKQISKGIRDIKKQSRVLQQTIEDDENIGGAIRDLRSALRGEEPTPARKPPKPAELPAATSAVGGAIAAGADALADGTAGDDAAANGAVGADGAVGTTAGTAPANGESTDAHGDSAVAHGESAVTHGGSTVAHGDSTVAHGGSTVAHGDSTVARGDSTVAHGGSTVANGAPAKSGAAFTEPATALATAVIAPGIAAEEAVAARAAITMPPAAGERDPDVPHPTEDDDAELAALVKPAAGTVAKGAAAIKADNEDG